MFVRDGEVVKDQQGDEGGVPWAFYCVPVQSNEPTNDQPNKYYQILHFHTFPIPPDCSPFHWIIFSPLNFSNLSAYNCKPSTTYAPFRTNLYLFQSPSSR